MPEPPEVIHLFRRQHGLITFDQALAAGMTPRQVENRAASGAWIRVCRAVYRVASSSVTLEQRALAACLHLGVGTYASHTTAGVLIGLEGIRPGRVEVTTLGSHHRSPIAVVHRSAHLPRGDVRRVNGVPCTRAARTLCDLAGRVPERTFLEAADGAIVNKDVTVRGLHLALVRSERAPGRQGGALVRGVLGLWDDGQPLPESVTEARLVRALLQRGFPPPARQVQVGKYRVDLAYAERRIALEYDGVRRHLVPNWARENALIAAGWRVLHAVAADLRLGVDTEFWRSLRAALA